ncbi:MAG: ATP-binding protein [Candidatus Saccharimonadales bacterium]
MKVESLILLIASTISLVCSLGLISLWRRNRHAVSLWSLLFVSSMWSLFVAMFLESHTPFYASVFVSMYYISAALTTLCGVGFALSYLGKGTRASRIPKNIIFGITIIAIVVFCTIPNFLVNSINLRTHVVDLNLVPYLIYGAYVILSFALAAIFFTMAIRKKDNRWNVRTGLKKVLGIWAIAGGAAAFFNLILPFLGNYSLIWIGPMMIVCQIPMTLMLATTTEHFSLGKIFIKGVVVLFGAIISILGALGVLFFLKDVVPIGLQTGVDEYYFYAVAICVGLIWSWVVFRVCRRLIVAIDSDGFNEAELLNDVSRITASGHRPEDFFRTVRRTLEKSFGIKRSDVIFFGQTTAIHVDYETEKIIEHLVGHNRRHAIYRGDVHSKIALAALEEQNIEVVVPVIGAIGNQTIGAIVLSPRRRKFDRHYGEILEKIASTLSPFIQSAVYHQEILKMNSKMKDEISRKTQKLRESNKELMKLDDMKDDLLTITSHNLRTPLTSILGFTEMLLGEKSGNLNDAQKSYAEAIMRSGNTMRQVVSDLLDVSHIDSGDFVLAQEPFCLTTLVSEEITALHELVSKKGRKLTYEHDEDIEMIGDAGRMRQVVINMIDNAIFYGKHKIEVSLHRIDGGFEFKVSDDGIGIPKAEQGKIFTKMFRASNAAIARPDGTGVGLFVSKSVIEAAGGEVIFESVEGKGSTFGFRLLNK